MVLKFYLFAIMFEAFFIFICYHYINTFFIILYSDSSQLTIILNHFCLFFCSQNTLIKNCWKAFFIDITMFKRISLSSSISYFYIIIKKK